MYLTATAEYITILTIILPWSADSEAAEADTPATLSDTSVRELFWPGTFKKELTWANNSGEIKDMGAELAIAEDELAVPAPCCCSNECASSNWDARLDAVTGIELTDVVVVGVDEEVEDTTAVPAFEPSEFVVFESGEGDSTAVLSGLLGAAVWVLEDLVQLVMTGEACSLVEGVVFAVGSFEGEPVTDFVCVWLVFACCWSCCCNVLGNGEEVKELPLGTVVAVTIPRGMFPPALTERERASISIE